MNPQTLKDIDSMTDAEVDQYLAGGQQGVSPKSVGDIDKMSDSEVDQYLGAKPEAQGIPETAVRGVAESASLGISEPIISAIKAGAGDSTLGKLASFTPIGASTALSNYLSTKSMPYINEFLGISPENQGNFEARSNEMDTAFNEDVASRRAGKIENPITNITSQLAGAFVPGPASFLGAGMNRLFRVGEIAKDAGTMAKVMDAGKRAVSAASSAAATVSAGSAIQQGIEESSGFQLPSEHVSLTDSAMLGAGIGAGGSLLGSGLSGAARLAGPVSKKLFATMFGIKSQSVSDFLEHAEEIASTPNIANKADELGQKAQVAVEKLSQAVEKGGAGIQDDVQRSLAGLRTFTSSLADDAETLVAESGLRWPIKKISALFDSATKKMSSESGPPYREAEKAIDDFRADWLSRVEMLPGDRVNGYSIKKLIRNLDTAGEAKYGENKLGSITSGAFKNLRRDLDVLLKDPVNGVTGYKEIMEPVASLTSLLAKATKRLNTAENIESVVGTLGGGSQSALKNSRLLKTIAKTLDSAEGITAKGWGDAQKSKALREISLSGKLKQYEEHVNLLKEVDSWGGDTAAGKFLSLGNRKQTPLQTQQLTKLSSLSDTDFNKQIKIMNTVSTFDKEITAASFRRSGIWAIVGGAISGSLPIAALGAVAGMFNDQFGPKIAKSILASVAKINGTPTYRKIMELGLPKEAEEALINSLARAFYVGEKESKSDFSATIPVSMRPQVAGDIFASETLTNTEKAEMSSSVYKTGEVSDVRKLIADKAEKKKNPFTRPPVMMDKAKPKVSFDDIRKKLKERARGL